LLLVIGGLGAAAISLVGYVLPALRHIEAALPDHAAMPAKPALTN
jgi:hypothetical protein